MSVTKDKWVTMSAEERKLESQASLEKAMALVKTGAFPTGIKFPILGKEYIARPVRVTDSGGVTYSVPPSPTVAGKRNARFNKFSFTIMGEGGTGSVTFDPSEEKFDI